MKEHVHVAKRQRIISQSVLIWLFVGLQVGLTIFFISKIVFTHRIVEILIINFCLSFLTVAGVIVFFNYYRHSFRKRFIISYDYLKFINEKTGEITEIKNSDIEKIYLVEHPKMSKLPWLFLGYFAFIDNKQNEIIINSYIMDISEFWLDSLTRKVDNKKLIRKEKTYPIIKSTS